MLIISICKAPFESQFYGSTMLSFVFWIASAPPTISAAQCKIPPTVLNTERINWIFNTMEIIIFSRSQSIIINAVHLPLGKRMIQIPDVLLLSFWKECAHWYSKLWNNLHERNSFYFLVSTSIYVPQNNNNDHNTSNIIIIFVYPII